MNLSTKIFLLFVITWNSIALLTFKEKEEANSNVKGNEVKRKLMVDVPWIGKYMLSIHKM